MILSADPTWLDHIFDNLIHNARKYSPSASTIEVDARIDGDVVAIDVRDFGVGIDAKDLAKVGRRYFRAATATGIAGTGIGLSVVKELTERLGGRLSVESVVGEGSTFTVFLPIHRRIEAAS